MCVSPHCDIGSSVAQQYELCMRLPEGDVLEATELTERLCAGVIKVVVGLSMLMSK